MDFAFINGLIRADAHAAARSVDERRHDQLLLLRLPDVREPDAPGAAAGDHQLQPVRRHRRRPGLRADRRRRARHHPALGPGGARRLHVGVRRQPRRLLAVPRERHAAQHGLLALVARGGARATRSTSSPSSAPSTATCTRTSWCCRSASCCSASCSTSASSRRAPRTQPRNPWRAIVPFALVAFVLGAMVAISNWELPMGVLVVALLAGRCATAAAALLARAPPARRCA